MALGVTHLVAGALAGTALAAVLGGDIGFVFFAMLASLLPDLDHPKSLLGRYVKPIGWFAKHRGLFHSVLAGATMTIMIELILRALGESTPYSLAALAGFLSHLALDACTRGGITPFYPSTLRLKGMRRVGGVAEYALLIIMAAATIWFWTH